MASKAICVGVGIPMMVVGALIALLWAPAEAEMGSTVEFVGSLIGILGAVFFIAGLFYAKEPVMH
jgi:flagellar biosynthesis protein FliQ